MPFLTLEDFLLVELGDISSGPTSAVLLEDAEPTMDSDSMSEDE
jgi:hypothetical protein